MALEKAKIIVHEGKFKGDYPVMFNPTEYSIEMSNFYPEEKTIGSKPMTQFTGTGGSSLSMELFFDTYGTEADVRDETEKIARLMERDSELHRPPLCSFAWGTMDPFKGVVDRVTQRFTMFMETGRPVRAVVSVTIKLHVSLKEQNQQKPLHSSDRTKQKTIKQGEHLWMMAEEEYADPGYWREIARANGIDNPRFLEPGRQLIIPPLE